MDAADRLAIAERSLVEGDVEAARRIVEVVLAQEPANADALRLRRAIDGTQVPASVPPEAYGDLRPDVRHLDGPRIDSPILPDARPAPPFGVALLAMLNVVSGGIGAGLGFLIMVAGSPLGLVFLGLGVFQLAAGVGLWRVRPWAWLVSIFVLGIGIVLNVVWAIGGDGWSLLFAIFQAIVLVYLVSVGHVFSSKPGLRALRRTRA